MMKVVTKEVRESAMREISQVTVLVMMKVLHS